MKYMINGAMGYMGREVLKLLGTRKPEIEVILVDVNADCESILTSPTDCKEKIDCIIDFSHHSATKTLTDYAVSTATPLVLATTGQTPEELAMIENAAKKIPVFFASNMSLGIAVLIRMAKEAAKAFPDADIEIVETHHNRKLDVPSGTALTIGKALQTVRPDAVLNIGRHENGKRAKKEIDIHSLRMGNVVGIHEVHICTQTQTITLRHEAHDRSLFAEGAIDAAKFLDRKPAGLYNMENLLGE